MKKFLSILLFISIVFFGGSYLYKMFQEINYDNSLLTSLNSKNNLIKTLPTSHKASNSNNGQVGFFVTGNNANPFNGSNSNIIKNLLNELQNNGNTNNPQNTVNNPTENRNLNSSNGNNNSASKGNLTLPKGNVVVNGITLLDTLKGNTAIYNMAQQITSNYTTNEDKAKALYLWIAANLTYNTNYADELTKGIFPQGQGTAIDAFNNRNAVCSGFASLYFVMAKDVGLEVKLVAGQGLSNPKTNTWGNHMWNEVYLNGQWVPVDTTFANSYTVVMKRLNAKPEAKGYLTDKTTYINRVQGNSVETYSVPSADFFNPPNFYNSHRDSQVLATWTKD